MAKSSSKKTAVSKKSKHSALAEKVKKSSVKKSGVTPSSARDLCYKAEMPSIKRGEVSHQLNLELDQFLRKLIRNTTAYTACRGLKVVTPDEVALGLKDIQFVVYEFSTTKKGKETEEEEAAPAAAATAEAVAT